MSEIGKAGFWHLGNLQIPTRNHILLDLHFLHFAEKCIPTSNLEIQKHKNYSHVKTTPAINLSPLMLQDNALCGEKLHFFSRCILHL